MAKTKTKTKSKSKSKSKTHLVVSYSTDTYEWGSLDKRIEKAAKCEMGGAGTGFGERDLSFWFKTRKQAERAWNNIEKLGHQLSFEITDVDDD